MVTRLIVLTFESVDEILWCGPSNETSSAVLSRGTIQYATGSTCYFCQNVTKVTIKMKPTTYIPMVLSLFNT